MIPEYLPKDCLFNVKDLRNQRWAVPYNYEATNTRAHVLLAENQKFIKGKRVLDLGCHFGTFAYIALHLGASFVKGLDSDKNLIAQAEQFFQYYHVDKKRYSFQQREVVSYLNSLDDNSFDVIFCLGLLYYIPESYYLLKQMARVAKTIILDTFTAYYAVIQGKDGMKFYSKIEESSFEVPLLISTRTQQKKRYYTLPGHAGVDKKCLSFLNCPTEALLYYYFESLGLSVTKLDWFAYLKNPYKHWKDLYSSEGKINAHWTDIYSTNIRVSYLLTFLPVGSISNSGQEH